MTGPAGSGSDPDAALRARVERWLLHGGLPHFIVGYRAATGVFTRASWLLVLIVIAELPINSWLDFPGARVATPALALAVVGAAIAGVNVARGRRWRARPRSIGWVELSIFVLGPALAHLILKGNPAASAGLAALNLALLGAIYLGTSYGVIPVVRSAIVQAWSQVIDILNVLLKSLPLLLLFGIFAFVNADTWGMAAQIHIPLLAIALGVVVATGGLFLLARTPQELQRMAAFDDWVQVRDLCSGTPAAGAAPRTAAPPDSLLLSRRERLNIGVLAVAAQAIQVCLVTLAIGSFFFALGLFLIPLATIEQWSGMSADQLASHRVGPAVEVFSAQIQVTRELIVVSTFVAVVSGLQFLIAALTDPSYRAEFTDQLTGRLRTALAVRALYRDALA